MMSVNMSCSTSVNRNIEKGEASLRLGDYTMAIHFFDDVLNRDPENFSARIGMGKALIQQASAKNNDSSTWNRALTHLEAARSLRPQCNVEPLLSDAWIVHARMLLDKKDTISALNSLARAIDLAPSAVEALNLAGIIYFRIGEPDKALTLFSRALAADTSKSFTYFNIGMVKWFQCDYEGARRLWFRAVKLAPQDKDIVYWYSVADKKVKGVAE
jgi:tetratricopeptide (TPR) repeat protein